MEFFSGALSIETAPEPPQRLFNRQCCKQHCHTFTGQSCRRRNTAASGIARVSGHARRNDGLRDHPKTVERGGNARHGSVPDVERLPLVSAPVVRSSNGDSESLCGGSGAVSTESAPENTRRAASCLRKSPPQSSRKKSVISSDNCCKAKNG